MFNDNDVYERYKAGDKTALSDIYKQYEPLIGSTVLQYKDTGLMPEALDLEAKRIMAASLKTYDPAKGNLTTHFQNNLKSMFRQTNRANQIYIPDSRASLYRKYKDAYTNMSEEMKRTPTDSEMADALKISLSDVRKLSKETGASIVADTNMADDDYGIETKEDHGSLARFIGGRIDNPIDKGIYDDSVNSDSPPSNIDLGKKYNITESAVRQRKDRLIKFIRDNQ